MTVLQPKTPEQLAQEAFATESGKRQAQIANQTPAEAISIAQANAAQARAMAQQGFNQSKDLRNAFVQGSSAFIKTRDAYTRIAAAAKDQSPAGDMALSYSFMKLVIKFFGRNFGRFDNLGLLDQHRYPPLSAILCTKLYITAMSRGQN